MEINIIKGLISFLNDSLILSLHSSLYIISYISKLFAIASHYSQEISPNLLEALGEKRITLLAINRK